MTPLAVKFGRFFFLAVNNEKEAIEKDNERIKWLEDKGYRVLRFWNNEVLKNMGGVSEKIGEALR